MSEYLISLAERDPKGNVIQTWPGSAGMPSHKLPTEGTMLSISSPLEAFLREQVSGSFDAAIGSCERLLAGLFPTISGPGDSQDYSSGVTRLASGELAIVLYDMVYDGVDLTSVAMDHMLELVENATDRVESCDCPSDAGCIRCVVDPRQQGLFIGGFPTFESMLHRIAPMSRYDGGRWIAVVASKDQAASAHRFMREEGRNPVGSPSRGAWQLGKLEFAVQSSSGM